MLDLVKFAFESGFWRFAGCFLIFYVIIEALIQTVIFLFNRFFRHWNIRKHGYPPSNCDADGDFLQTESEQKQEDYE